MTGKPREPGFGSRAYRVLFELGQGGTANVALAMADGPEGSPGLFVIKRLRPAYAHDAEFRAMFMTEARLSVQLDHPHVVRVYDVSELGEVPTISMEYIEGQTLDAVLAAGEPELPLDLHVRILADVLSGLHYAHELRDVDGAPLDVVHRDVSPHNVMVSYEGVVKVLDFGIAKLAGSTVETEAGIIKGKLRYMPPEQVAGEKVDRRADVFAVGVMLWEALSGTTLWKGLPDATIMSRVLSKQIPSPDDRGGAIPAELLAICGRALAPDREQRYQTALAFQQALEDYLSKRPQRVTERELGQLMRERFASLRRAVRERIEGELTLRNAPVSPSAPSRSGFSASSPRAEAARSKPWLLALMLLALGVVILGWGMRRRAPTLPTTSPVLASPAGDASSDVAERRAASPPPMALPSAVASGKVASPAVTESATSPKRRAPSSPSARPTASSPATASSPPSASVAALPSASVAAPPPSCVPPFTLDASGIKQFKPECL